MNRKMTQLRFDISDLALLLNNNIFQDYAPILHLGIQAPSGLKFYLNDNKFAPLYVNNSGIFEINLENTFGLIGSISFDQVNLNKLLPQGYLIIDILYEGEG